MVQIHILSKPLLTRYVFFGARHLCFYVQGQSPRPHVREYFYYVDHNGQLFLDDTRFKNFTSCFKDLTFLEFFFSRIQVNETERYENQFPFLSLCGRERNYLRCDDKPLVFVDLKQSLPDLKWYLLYASENTRKLRVPFAPEHLHMCPQSGRIYHPTNRQPKSGERQVYSDLSVGLLCSRLATNLSPNFQWTGPVSQDGPSEFLWERQSYKLSKMLSKLLHSNA
ncbi:hypothetical protein FBUS_01189 [Fasciolopsis buskii]|uniref:Uncharacterized protein n=1 Tax=Fasciolopsis buskii TaxID=27845 RepID=A0A8E0RRC4_9TREM|nr:hypothetical protein FBUS_01189 [Fasciolopsis buski]